MASEAERADAACAHHGFEDDLYWRLACFLEPLSWSEYCGCCVRVCSHMAMLPCCHVTCAGCYAQRSRMCYGCVLDPQASRQQDVADIVFSRQDLAARHVRYGAGTPSEAARPRRFHSWSDSTSASSGLTGLSDASGWNAPGEAVAHLASGCSPDKPLYRQLSTTGGKLIAAYNAALLCTQTDAFLIFVRQGLPVSSRKEFIFDV